MSAEGKKKKNLDNQHNSQTMFFAQGLPTEENVYLHSNCKRPGKKGFEKIPKNSSHIPFYVKLPTFEA